MVFDWASIVAAFILARYGPAIRSAAFKNIAALLCQGILDQASRDLSAVLIASSIFFLLAL